MRCTSYDIPDLGLVMEERFVNLYDDSRTPKHEWSISVEETPAAYVTEVLIGLNGTLLLYFRLLCCISHWVLTHPPVHQDNPLPECQLGLLKKSPVTQAS